MIRLAFTALLTGVLTGFLGGPAAAERRLGFVVGVNQYANLSAERQLQNAVADAETVGSALQDLGFTVTRLTRGVTLQNFLDQFEGFKRAIEPGDIVVFYFAGHGIAVSGTNYLIPADIPALTANNESTVRKLALAEADLIADLRERGARVTLMVIDACRDNPFPKTGTRALGSARGLARNEPPRGVFSLYSAGAGQEALDHLPSQPGSRNSLFTHVFVAQLRKPISLLDLSETVREEVSELARKANHEQMPSYYNEISGARSIYLAGRPEAAPVPPQAGDRALLNLVAGLSDRTLLTTLIEHESPAVREAAQLRIAALPRDELRPGSAPKAQTDTPAGSLVPQLGHHDSIHAVVFSQDGRFLVSGSEDGTAKFWSVADGRLLRSLEGYAMRITAAAISTDNRRILVGGRENVLVLWDALSGEVVRRYRTQDIEVGGVAFMPDGRRFLVSGRKDLFLRDIEAGSQITKFGEVRSGEKFSVSKDGKRLVTSDWDGLNLWDTETGSRVRTIKTESSPEAFGVTADGSRVAFAQEGGSVTLADARDGTVLHKTEAAGDEIKRIMISADGRRYVTAGKDTLRIWDGSSGQLRGTIETNQSGIAAADLMSDSRYIVTAGHDRSLKLWDAELRHEVRRFGTDMQPYRATVFEFSPDGHYLAAGHSDGSIRVWDIQGREPPRHLKAYAKPITALAFSPDSQQLVSGDEDATLRFWNVRSGRQTHGFEKRVGAIWSLGFSKDGRFLAVSALKAGATEIWDAEAKRPLRTLKFGVVAFLPDGKRLAAATGKAIRILDFEGKRVLQTFAEESLPVVTLQPSQDGKRVLSRSIGGKWLDWYTQYELRDLNTGRVIRNLHPTADRVTLVASPEQAVSVSRDAFSNTGTLDDVDSGKEIGRYDFASDLVGLREIDLRAGFSKMSADGRLWASGSRGADIQLRETGTGRLVARLIAMPDDQSVALFTSGEVVSSEGGRDLLAVVKGQEASPLARP